MSKDATNTSEASLVSCTPFNETTAKTLIRVGYAPSVAGTNIGETIMLPYPIKLKRGSIINSTNTNGTASIDQSVTIYFYEVDPQ